MKTEKSGKIQVNLKLYLKARKNKSKAYLNLISCFGQISSLQISRELRLPVEFCRSEYT
jgi:hypothetical protein